MGNEKGKSVRVQGEGKLEDERGSFWQTAVPLLVLGWICVFKKLHRCAFALLNNQEVGERIDGQTMEQSFEAASRCENLYWI